MKTLPIYLLTNKRKFAAGFVEVEWLKRLANEIVSFSRKLGNGTLTLGWVAL
jgi:hypothetical protein